MGMKFKGTAIVIQGDHVNLDRAMSWYSGMESLPSKEIATKFMVNISPDIPKRAKKNDIVVGGNDFGCGKGHFSFWIAIKEIGIKCIVAESCSTQMLQNGVTYQAYLVEVPGILAAVEMGDEIEVDIESAEVKNITRNTVIKGQPFPPFLLEVMKSGGHLEYLRKKIAGREDTFDEEYCKGV